MVDIRRILGLCLVGAAPAWAAITNVRVIGTTPVSAVLGYTAPDYGACSVSVSEYSDLLPLVHDVNPALFPGADQDSRTGSVTTGRNRVFVAGQGTTATASDSRRYSRALQTNTLHYYKITCGSDTATGTFQTANIGLGRTHSEAIQADAREPGAYLQPTVGYNVAHTGSVNTSGTVVTLVSGHNFNPNWRRGATITINGVNFALAGVNSPTQLTLQTTAGAQSSVSYTASDRDERIIDPSSGVLLRHVSFPQDNGISDISVLGQTFTAAAGSAWMNPSSILAQDGAYATYSGSGQDILTLTITPSLYSNASLDAIRLHLYGRAAAGTVDDRTVQACIDINNDAVCDTDWQEVTLGTSDGDAYIGTLYPIDTWRNPANYIYPLLLSDVRANSNFRILLKKKTTAANTIYLDSAKLDVYGSAKVTASDGGSMEMCSNNLSSNGYYHCTGITPGGDSNLYAFEPTTGEARFLGRLRTTVDGLFRRFGPDNTGWDVSDPNVFYATALSTTETLYKCTLTGNDVAVPQDSNASMSCTDLLAGQTLGDRVYAFDSTYDKTKFTCFLDGVQNQYGLGECRRGGQDSYGWLFVIDLTSGPPANVIAATAAYAAPRTRWTGIHSYDTPGHQNAWGISLAYLTSSGGTGLGPYTVSLQTAMNSSDTTSTINLTSTWNAGWGTAPAQYHKGEPLSQYDDHFLQTIAVGDVIQIGSEWMKVTARSYPDADNLQVTVTRGYLSTTKAAHSAGDTGIMRSDLGIAGTAEGIWKFLLDPHGSDTTNTYFVADTVADGHLTRRLDRKFMSGVPMTMERSQSQAAMDAPAVVERVNIETSPEFARKWANGNPNDWQAHATYHQVKATSPEREWGLDSHPLNNYSSSPTITLQPGTTGVYKLSTSLNRKHFETLAFCGYKPLRDISSPATGDQITDATPYTRCSANAANECRTGSAAGDNYVSCPGLSSPGGCSQSANSICLGDWPFNGYNIMQWGFGSNHEGSRSIAPAAFGAGYSRPLARGVATRYQTLYWNTKALAYGDWAWTEFDAVERPDMWFLKIPPFPTKDSVSRATFVPVPVKLTPPAGLGVNNAVVEFGYDSSFRCTSRNESCFANTASIDETNPFVWPSDVGGETSISGLACTSGCWVSIPALSQKVLYYRWKYRDAGNVTLATGATQVYVVP